MNAIKRYITGLLLGKWIKPIIASLDGKKTVLGAITLVLWVVIYAIPTLWPDLAYIADWGKQLQELLESQGLVFDKELLGTGLGLTLIGLIDKVRKLLAS